MTRSLAIAAIVFAATVAQQTRDSAGAMDPAGTVGTCWNNCRTRSANQACARSDRDADRWRVAARPRDGDRR